MSVVDSMGRSSAPATSSEWLSIGAASRMFSIHENTLRNAANAGRLRSYRLNAASFGGKSHRRFAKQDIMEWLGLQQEKSVNADSEAATLPKVLLVARVSSSGQKADLDRQIKRLEDYAENRWKGKCEVHKYVRISSGLNYNAPGLLTLVNHILSGKLDNSTLVITHRDRLIRFGFRAKGYSLREVHKQIEKAGANKSADGKSFGLQVTRRILASATSLASRNEPSGGSFAAFLKAKLRVGGPGAKITRAKILSAYSAHCERTGERRVSRKLCLEQLSKHVQKLNVQVTENGDSVLYTGLNLIPHSVTTASKA